MEQSSIWDWWVLILDNNLEVLGLDDLPSLVGTVVAVPEDNMTTIVIVTSVNVQTLTSVISDVSSRSSIDSDSLVDLRSPDSNNSSLTNVESLTSLVTENKVSSIPGSDGSGS